FIDVSGDAIQLSKHLHNSIAYVSQYGTIVTQRGTDGHMIHASRSTPRKYIEHLPILFNSLV
ncbi:MAG: hypothetical protein ABEI13_03950, partial [Candidatus Paceibacteria bacterium]